METYQLTGAYYQDVSDIEKYEGRIPPAARVEYKGHQVNSGGLQGHSLGGEYPYLVYKKGTPRGEFWVVLDTRTSEDLKHFYQQETAVQYVRNLKG